MVSNNRKMGPESDNISFEKASNWKNNACRQFRAAGNVLKIIINDVLPSIISLVK